MIKVRFAPSPTGYLHIGGARTALFNWMYARTQQGKFVLRIEDTDRERSKPEYLDEILKSMEWLGMSWDEFYRQSERFDLYREHAEKLVAEGKAYHEGAAILLRIEKDQEIKLFDIIRGEIQFDSDVLKDEVLLKSDGSATYSFACVVDDALMEISHVIRGEDHISNTPKQLLIYQALGFKPPKFAHMPLIMAEDGSRLSKRTGAVAVSDYQRDGFLPEALVNYLMLLGWSPGDNQEMISLDAAVKRFSIKKVNKSAAAFSMEKLRWLNGQYIKQMDVDQLAAGLVPFLKERGSLKDDYDSNRLKDIIKLYKSRMATFVEFSERTKYLFSDDYPLDAQTREKHFDQDRAKEFCFIAEKMESLKVYQKDEIEKAFREAVSELGLQPSDLVHSVRVALTGTDVGPGLFETMELLGKEKTVERLKNFIR